MITHRSFSTTLEYQNKAMGLTKNSCVLDSAFYAFDLACHSVLQTLTVGG